MSTLLLCFRYYCHLRSLGSRCCRSTNVVKRAGKRMRRWAMGFPQCLETRPRVRSALVDAFSFSTLMHVREATRWWCLSSFLFACVLCAGYYSGTELYYVFRSTEFIRDPVGFVCNSFPLCLLLAILTVSSSFLPPQGSSHLDTCGTNTRWCSTRSAT
jgi:hypothetical protein